MNHLNKHSAQLEEVWLGRSHFLYIYTWKSHHIQTGKTKKPPKNKQKNPPTPDS